MNICNAEKNGIVKRIINPYTQDIRIANPNGQNGRKSEIASFLAMTGIRNS